jgi:hypothetical protein
MGSREAIQNARLFREIEDESRQLEFDLRSLQAAGHNSQCRRTTHEVEAVADQRAGLHVLPESRDRRNAALEQCLRDDRAIAQEYRACGQNDRLPAGIVYRAKCASVALLALHATGCGLDPDLPGRGGPRVTCNGGGPRVARRWQRPPFHLTLLVTAGHRSLSTSPSRTTLAASDPGVDHAQNRQDDAVRAKNRVDRTTPSPSTVPARPRT